MWPPVQPHAFQHTHTLDEPLGLDQLATGGDRQHLNLLTVLDPMFTLFPTLDCRRDYVVVAITWHGHHNSI